MVSWGQNLGPPVENNPSKNGIAWLASARQFPTARCWLSENIFHSKCDVLTIANHCAICSEHICCWRCSLHWLLFIRCLPCIEPSCELLGAVLWCLNVWGVSIFLSLEVRKEHCPGHCRRGRHRRVEAEEPVLRSGTLHFISLSLSFCWWIHSSLLETLENGLVYLDCVVLLLWWLVYLFPKHYCTSVV